VSKDAIAEPIHSWPHLGSDVGGGRLVNGIPIEPEVTARRHEILQKLVGAA